MMYVDLPLPTFFKKMGGALIWGLNWRNTINEKNWYNLVLLNFRQIMSSYFKLFIQGLSKYYFNLI